MFDIDKDGKLNAEELKQIFSKEKVGIFKRMSAHQTETPDEGTDMIMQIMKEVDKDGDNEISYEEFNDALTKRL